MTENELLKLDNPLVYKKELKITYSDLNEYGEIFPQRYLQFFQDVSAEHCNLMHMGFNDLIGQNIIWVLNKVRFTKLGDYTSPDIIIMTIVRKPTRIRYERDYLIFNDGKVIVRGEGEYCTVNFKTRRLLLSGLTYPSSDFPEYVNYQTPFPLLKAEGKEENEPVYVHKVVFTDLDENRHANNTSYARWINDAVAGRLGNHDIIDMQFHYSEECSEGELISIFEEKKDDLHSLFTGRKADGTVSFISAVSFLEKKR